MYKVKHFNIYALWGKLYFQSGFQLIYIITNKYFLSSGIIYLIQLHGKRLPCRKKHATVLTDRNSSSKGTLGVRWEKVRRNDPKMLTTTEWLGIIMCVHCENI